jgi:hypothetical protein
MQRFDRKRAAALALVVVLPSLGACSTDLGGVNIVPKPNLRPDWLRYSGHKEEFTLRAAGPADLVSPDGQCAAPQAPEAPAATEPTDPNAPPALAGGIALQMTECDVVNRIGAPDRVELGSNERGERTALITYTRGARPGLYRFVDGRLKSIERVAEPAPERPKKKSTPKRRS